MKLKFNQSNIIHLLEGLPSGKAWKVMIIEEGLSKNGRYYTEEALKNATHLFEKSKVCYYEWKDKHFDHLPLSIEKIRPEGFPLQTAGYLDNVKYETVNIKGRQSTGLTGHMHLLDTSAKGLREILMTAWKKGMDNLLGLSINAEGDSFVRMLNGIPINVVTAIKRVLSTDFVTQPAAGGGLLKIMESINQQEGGKNQMFKKLLEALKKMKPKIMEGIDIDNVTQEEVVGIFGKLVKEAQEGKSPKLAQIEAISGKVKEGKFDEAETLLASLDETPAEEKPAEEKPAEEKPAEEKKDDGAEAVAEAKDILKKAEGVLAEAEKKSQVRECKVALTESLAESKLPPIVKSKIQKRFDGKIFKESELKETIKDERDTLAKLIESGADIDLGDSEGMFVTKEPTDRLQASLDLMMGVVPEKDDKDYEGIEKFSSLREAYVKYTDDPGITGRMGPRALSRL